MVSVKVEHWLGLCEFGPKLVNLDETDLSISWFISDHLGLQVLWVIVGIGWVYSDWTHFGQR